MPSLARKKIDGTLIERTELPKETVTFGRGERATVRVHDDRMSRQHFALKPADDGHRIQDLQSTNGTYVNGQRIQEIALKHNDKIRAGSTVWIYEVTSAKGLATVIGELSQEKKGFSTLMGEISKEAK